ncbi:MAG: cytochrome c [Aureispira sp.]|nr:cytochrome c [Aureispira sp.]
MYPKLNLTTVFKSLILILGILSCQDAQAADPDGKTLFMNKCAACHSTGSTKLTGPGLEGVNERFEKNWLYSWIRNSTALIESGDSLAIQVFEAGNKIPMLSFEDLTDQDIDAILAYIANPKAKEETTTVAATNEDDDVSPVAQQVEIWSDGSKGVSIFTLGPLMILAVVLIVMVVVSKRVPGL